MLNFFSNIYIKLERVLFALHILLFLKKNRRYWVGTDDLYVASALVLGEKK